MEAGGWGLWSARTGRLAFGRGVYTPEGLSVPDPVIGDATLPWDEFHEGELPRGGWCLLLGPTGPYGTVSLTAQSAEPRERGGRTRALATGSASAIPEMDAAMALAQYLRDTPAARAGLGVPHRAGALAAALRRAAAPHHLPREPLMGDRHDLHHAVLHGLADLTPRRYRLRAVAGDPPPADGAAVAAVRHRLRPGLRDRITDDEIAERLAPYLALEPWPFPMLLG